MKKQHVFAVSGVKNSGKTTLIERLIPLFAAENLSVSVIKHDGHDFVPDVPDTDSYRLRNAGAQGVAVFSGRRMMIIRQCGEISERELMRAFPDSDVIILEGFKYSEYPKIEAVRRDVSDGRSAIPLIFWESSRTMNRRSCRRSTGIFPYTARKRRRDWQSFS